MGELQYLRSGDIVAFNERVSWRAYDETPNSCQRVEVVDVNCPPIDGKTAVFVRALVNLPDDDPAREYAWPVNESAVGQRFPVPVREIYDFWDRFVAAKIAEAAAKSENRQAVDLLEAMRERIDPFGPVQIAHWGDESEWVRMSASTFLAIMRQATGQTDPDAPDTELLTG